MPTTWDIANASYDGIQKDISILAPTCESIHFKPDGTKLFVTEFTGGGKIGSFDLSTPWDLSTLAGSGNTFDTSAYSERLRGMWWHPDGFWVYVADDNTISGRTMWRYTVSQAWSTSSAHWVSADRDAIAINSHGVPRDATGLYIKPDGTLVFHLSANSPRVWRSEMDPAWDLNTLALDPPTGGDFVLANESPQGIFLSPDGTQMLIAYASTQTIRSYTLSTPFDVTTATDDGAFLDVGAQGITIGDIYVAPEGVDKLYVVESTNTPRVFQYSLPPAAAPGGGWGRIPFGGS